MDKIDIASRTARRPGLVVRPMLSPANGWLCRDNLGSMSGTGA